MTVFWFLAGVVVGLLVAFFAMALGQLLAMNDDEQPKHDQFTRPP